MDGIVSVQAASHTPGGGAGDRRPAVPCVF